MASFMMQYPANETPMQHYRLLGRSGLRASPICLGTMTFGDTEWAGMLGECNKETAREIFETYVAAGGNFFDTASFYQNGMSEEWLGEFIAESKVAKRENLIVATKYTGAHPFGLVNLAGNHRKNLVESVERSLRRLKLAYIDILYVHFYDGTQSPLDLMTSLNYLVASGKVLHLGVSDTPAWYVAACQTLANERGLAPFTVYQGKYGAIERDAEAELLPMCREFNIAYVPWSVLGGGKLASKSGSSRGNTLSDAEAKVQTAVFEVAERIGKSPASVATSWAAARLPSVMVGVRKVSQLKEALDGVSFRLSDADDAKITDAFGLKLPFPAAMLGTDFRRWSLPAIMRCGGRVVDHFDAPIATDVKK